MSETQTTLGMTDELIEWREQIGVRLMLSMRCTHQGDDFGSKAVCVTCFDNIQRVGEIARVAAANSLRSRCSAVVS